MIGGNEGVGKAEPTRTRQGGLGMRSQRGFEDGDAGAFAADQRAGDVEAVFGQELVEVVAGDAARECRGNSRGSRVGVACRGCAQAGVDFADASAARMMRVEFCFGGVAPTVMRVPS